MVEVLEPRNLLNEIVPLPTITVDESAHRLGVSTGTIHNWIKTNYLKQAGKGRITIESLEQFQAEISGKDKLTHRANKSSKDYHDHDKTVFYFLNKISSSIDLSDTVGIEYEGSLSDSFRNKEGIYYTPNGIVGDLFSEPKNDIQDASFCDPCCGSGNFILRAIELGFKPQNIYGYDVDPVAVEITKARVFRATGYQSNNIQVIDFLDMVTSQEKPSFDYIYTNPPWGKKLAKARRESLGLKLGAEQSIDSCSLFFFACLQSLKQKGMLGLLLPESFFNIATFEDARIRALQCSIEKLTDYGKAFKGLITSAQAIVLKKQTAHPHAKIVCNLKTSTHTRTVTSFSCNPKSILNISCNEQDASTIQYLRSIPFITLKNQGDWGLGIVTGNNKKFIRPKPESGYIPVYKGADITPDKLKAANNFIPSDMSIYQQVAPIQLYEAKEKLIYKFISSKLCFFYDNRQRYILNSANMFIPYPSFPIPAKVLGQLLSSTFMNWLFSKIFNTHKILRGDLEALPIYSQFLKEVSRFDEATYLERLNIERKNGTYRIKR